MPKAYWIGIVDVKNQEEYKKYADLSLIHISEPTRPY